MTYPFKYPMHLLVLVPFIPAAIFFTIAVPLIFPPYVRWMMISTVWGTLVSCGIGIWLDTYVPEKE